MRQQTINLLLAHEKLIAHVARKFSETTGFDAEELISFGRATLIRKSKKWDASRGKFSTFLYWLLRSEFTDYIHKQRREVFVEVYEESVEAPTTYSAIPTLVADLLNSLQGDALQIVKVSLESKWSDGWSNLRSLLQKEMTRQGWDEQRFVSAYNEVQQQVKAW